VMLCRFEQIRRSWRSIHPLARQLKQSAHRFRSTAAAAADANFSLRTAGVEPFDFAL